MFPSDRPRFPSSHADGAQHAPKRAPKAAQPKGHEAFLKALEASGATVIVEMNDGSSLTGTIKHSDKYTISLKVSKEAEKGDGAYQVYVIFKHSITLFYTPGKGAD